MPAPTPVPSPSIPHLPELNYHHLRYFWTVAHEGSIAKACSVLKVSQPTVSEQLRALATSVGAELFVREGRRLRLTDTGRLVQDFADEIFTLGRELHTALQNRRSTRAIPVVIGISDAVPKLIAGRLLAPAMQLPEPVQITVQEDRHEALIQRLAGHELDVVISDAPVESHLRIRAYSHLLGESPLAVFGARRFAGLARGFPASLADAPLLAALPGTPQRRAWDAWCTEIGVQPRIVAQVQDSALLKALAQGGFGLFAGPEAIAEAICRTFEVRVLGRIPALKERYFVISLDRRLVNPALQAITTQGKLIFS